MGAPGSAWTTWSLRRAAGWRTRSPARCSHSPVIVCTECCRASRLSDATRGPRMLAQGDGRRQVIPPVPSLFARFRPISPVFPPFPPVVCAFSPSRRGGSNGPQAGTQGQETAARGPRPEISALHSTPQMLTKGSTGRTLDADDRVVGGTNEGAVPAESDRGAGEVPARLSPLQLRAATIDQVIRTPLHVLGRISPIFPPFFPVFCAFSPSRQDGSNEPQAGIQGQETAGTGVQTEGKTVSPG
eukprot:COSAG04_NODE_3938_length_2410_cov_2.020338_2_plen_243_part_00